MEDKLMEAVTDLTKIISGLQDSVASLITAGTLLKERIERLEGEAPWKGYENGKEII